MKTLFLSLMLLLSVALFSQSRATTMSYSGDTVTNTGTKYLLFRVIQPADVASFQVVNKKFSGTVAGKTYFKGSLDGTNYVKLDSLTNLNTPADSINTKLFSDNPPKYIYYKLESTGSGNMKMVTRGYAITRKL